MPLLSLTGDDRAIRVDLLRETITRDRFPLSPRLRSRKAIFELDPPVERLEPLPPPKPSGKRKMALTRKPRR